jgi:RND family efflux transporter MFP subunit
MRSDDIKNPSKDTKELQPGDDQERQSSSGSGKMRKVLINLILALILLAGAAAVAWQFYGDELRKVLWVSKTGEKAGQRATVQTREVYYCPMHKAYESDKPGNCPICSMKLLKKEVAPSGGDASAQVEKSASKTSEMPGMPMPGTPAGPGAQTGENTVFIAPQQQQIIGVQTAPATLRLLEREIRAVGKIAFDATKVTHIHTKVSGWIEQVFANFVGKFIKKGDPLFTIYSPDLVATQEEYLLALRARRELATSSIEHVALGAERLVDASRQRLRLWDVTDEEIVRLEKEGKARRDITVYSPTSGVVTELAAYHHGRYITPELDLYTIVDLSTVWALGEIYEYDLPLVRQGQKVLVELPNADGSPAMTGIISFIYPYLNPATRTGQIRIVFDNPGQRLKPDMFVNLKLRIDLGRQLTVPEDAVLNTGTQQYVFVDKGDGQFEPREVKLGMQAEGSYAIKQGLKQGERVATAANFILDSESRLKGAFANMGVPKQPATAGAMAAEQLRIELHTQPDPAKTGDNMVRVKVADSKGTPISDASVKVKINMPAMGSMAPLSSEAQLSRQGNGEYTGRLNIPLAWTWQTTVTVERAGQLLGSGNFNITAR